MKKILFINNHFQYSDGTVTALISLCNHLNQEMYDITILPLFKCDMKRKVELREDIKLKKGLGFYFRGLSKILNVIPKSILYKSFVKDDYDIEIAFQCDNPTRIVGGSRNESACHVAWMHGYQLEQDFHNMDKVVCVSRFNRDRCINEMNGADNVTYLYNILDDASIVEKSKEDVDDIPEGDGPLLVTVGRLSPEKGFLRLVDIMSSLKQEGYKFRLMIIGGGDLYEELALKIEKLDLQDSVFLLGSNNNPHKYTAKADLFVCSSFSEGYSTAASEALLLGTPVVTTSVPGGEEMISDAECGLVTDVDDDSLKDGIRSILANSEILSEWKRILMGTKNKFSSVDRTECAAELFNEFSLISDRKKNFHK